MAESVSDPRKNKASGGVVFTVSQINEYISRKMFSDPFLTTVKVVGEVTNLSRSSVGHVFFTLKDENAMLDCIVYDSESFDAADAIVDGALLELGGRVAFYRKSASVQLIVETVSPGGMGDLFARFEQTKQKLYREGLFDPGRKKPLPAFVWKIGVVTSPSGAVLHDIINVSTRRFDGIHIVVYPAPVQGPDAAERVCFGIEHFNSKHDVDVIIVARGGGSFEDLAAFNEECVARAVAASKIPVVSAVGHETDYSLCDMAADLRAPTPSAAAEMVVREKRVIQQALEDREKTLLDALEDVLTSHTARLDRLKGAIGAYTPRMVLNRAQETLNVHTGLLKSGIQGRLSRCDMQLDKYRGLLESLSPKRVLDRGYAIVHGENGIMVSALQSDNNMEIEFSDGRVAVTKRGQTPNG